MVAEPEKMAFESYHWSFQMATGSGVQCARSREAQWPHTGPEPPASERWSWKKTWYMSCFGSYITPFGSFSPQPMPLLRW